MQLIDFTYYPWPLSPSPCTITTVDRCSVSAGKTTGAGMLLNMAGRLMPVVDVILMLLRVASLVCGGWKLRVAVKARNIKFLARALLKCGEAVHKAQNTKASLLST